MKNIKAKSTLMVTLLSAMALCSCGGGGSKIDPSVEQVSIMAYNGGYGTDWLQDICEEFTRQTGIIATYSPDSTILNKIESQLTGTCEYDIFMSHGLAWQNFASRGLLAPLDDLYASEVEGGVTFESRVLPEALNHVRYTDKDDTEHYFKVPFTQGLGGFIYNVDMFEEKGWAIPKTYDELTALCAQIVSDTGGAVKPFAWAAARDYYWDYPIYEWWAELEGKENYEKWFDLKGADGTYSSGYESYDPNGKFSNFKKAFKMWFDLVGTHPEYCNDKAYSASLLTAQNQFFNQKAAMIPYAQWCKKEIEKAMKKSFTFNIAMMPTPKAKSTTAKNVNFMVGFGDSMIVPKKARHLENAKKFLAFLSSEYACKTFVEKADGPFLGFDYSDIDLSSITANNTYIASLHNILTTSENISTDSNNPLLVTNGDTFIQPWVNNKRYYKEVSSGQATSVDAIMNEVFETARDAWPAWVRNAGVR